MKKAVTLSMYILMFAVVLMSLAVTAMAEDSEWTYEEFTYGDTAGIAVTGYAGSDTDLYIPGEIDGKTVLKIGDGFMAGNTSLNSVTMAESIKIIGDGAFSKMTNLVCVLLPEGLETIGADAFSGCTAFNSVILYDGLTDVGDGAFSGCDSLTVYCNEGTVGYDFASANGISIEILNPEAVPDIREIDGVTYYISNGTVLLMKFDNSHTNDIIVPAYIDGYPVTEINESAFFQTDIINVVLPDTITLIGKSAFGWCQKLESVNIPQGITIIDDYTFVSCYKLEEISIPDSVTRIGFQAFANTGLKSITYPHNLQSIGQQAFMGTNLTEVIYPAEVEMEPNVFSQIKTLKKATVSEGVTELAYGTFGYCSNLETVELPESLKTINGRSFYECSSLGIIRIPENVSLIFSGEFYNCPNLVLCVTENSYAHNFAINNNLLYYVSDSAELPEIVINDGVKYLVDNNKAILMSCDKTKTGTLVIPDTINDVPVTEMNKAAFQNCKINNITIPETITVIPDSAFDNCSLSGINLHSGITLIGHNAFRQCPIKTLECPENLTYIGNSAFEYCMWLTEIKFNSKIAYIGNSAFYGAQYITELDYPAATAAVGAAAFGRCTRLKTVTFPENLTTLPTGVFKECESLGTILIPSSVNSIGNNAFESAKSVIICGYANSYAIEYAAANNIPYCITEDGTIPADIIIDGVKYYISNNEATIISCDVSNTVTLLNIPETVNGYPVTKVESYAFRNSGNIDELVLPDTITDIGEYAFYQTEVKKVNLPKNLKTLNNSVFNNAPITNIELPSELERIEESAFEHSTLTTMPELPSSTTYIGAKAFFHSNIKNAVLPANVELGTSVFWYCQYLVEAQIEDGVTKIPEGTFAYCFKLQNIVIPDSVTEIEKRAFDNCWELSATVIPESVTSIGYDAFSGSPKVVLCVYENSYAHEWAIENSVPYFVISKTPNPEIAYGTGISGTVKYTDGTVASGAAAELLYDDGVVKETVTTDETGAYSFTYAEVGRYTIRVTDENGNTASEQVSVNRKNVFDVILTGETNLTLKAGWTVSGTVTADSSVTVTLTDTDGNIIKTVVAENGKYVFENVPNGDYIIKAEAETGSAVKEITVFNENVMADDIEISGEYASIEGYVQVEGRDYDKHYRQWAQITVYNNEGTAVASGKTDKNGYYSFNALPCGEYTIVAEATEMRDHHDHGYTRPLELKGYGYIDAELAQLYIVETIVLSEEDDNDRATISGKVTAHGQTQKCEVILTNVFRHEISRYETAKNGKYQFNDVKDGLYIIIARTERDGVGFAVVTVRHGKVYGTTDITIYKGSHIREHEDNLNDIPYCGNKEDARHYKDRILEEKRYYDGLSHKEKKQFSKDYEDRLNKLIEMLSECDYEKPDDVEIHGGGMIVSPDDVNDNLDNKKKLKFKLTVDTKDKWELDENGIDTDEKYYQQFIEDTADGRGLGQYYDISLKCERNGVEYEISDVRKDTDTTGKIRLTLPIPEEYRGHKKYSFIHVHNGEPVTLVDLDKNPDTITFEIDRFSTFALAYSDTEDTTDFPDYATISYTDGSITATATTDATLYIAEYDVNGRFASVKMYPLTANLSSESYAFSNTSKAFVLDSDLSPLCDVYTIE